MFVLFISGNHVIENDFRSSDRVKEVSAVQEPPLPAFPVSDVSGKVWSTLITTQQARIYPKGLLLTSYLNVQIATCCTLATALSGAGCAL